jgi:hypothetical protein
MNYRIYEVTARAECPFCGHTVYKSVEPITKEHIFTCFNQDADSVRPRPSGCRNKFIADVVITVIVNNIRKVE